MNNLPKIKIGKKPNYIKFGEDLDFYALFEKIEQEFKTCFILESLGEEEKFSRYSIIGFDPEQTISAKDNNLIVNGKNYPVKNPYYALNEMMPEETIARSYAGGLIGYLNYDAVNYMEPSSTFRPIYVWCLS